ncbi:uncharacterized protein MKK02DRAFT_19624 [Dioszegia hungarica]|uniref:F-box domain-containing protein n=1 Tax=Dioszegia hungarica TaxID=4972 RepID=A0AA38H3E8_9TREE|nr:uncharacterized protein MKK02DRAFT_19624 [Dioszegia hungarica]KAI9633021.1 hypothetical protein MKK02DRAFT_19624 [Dioszegia hungarica]
MDTLTTELFLRILSFLDAHALAGVQGVNSYWARMSLDPQLWKRLYLARYPHPHHLKLVYQSTTPSRSSYQSTTPSRSSHSPATPRSLRPIARLPSRAFPPPSPSRSPSLRAPVPVPVSYSNGTHAGPSAGAGQAIPFSRRELAEVIDGEAEVGTGVRNDGVDWKLMLRLGTNWSRGNASSQTSITLPPSPSPSIASTDLPLTTPGRTSREADASATEQHIALSPSFIFTSNPTSPLVHVHSASSSSVRLGIIPPPPGWSSPSRPDNVTAIAADQSAAADVHELGNTESGRKRDLPARLAVFYQSGGYVILSIRTTDTAGSRRMSWSREAVSPPTQRPRRRSTSYAPRMGDPVVLATLHHPVLVACTLGFHVSVYSFSSTATSSTSSTPVTPRHLSTLHSDVSYHPAALSLFPAPSSSPTPPSFRASLTYCTPVYPSSWTVAAQEFDISLASYTVDRAECYHVGPNPGSELDSDEEIVWPRRIQPVIGVKGERAMGIGTDGRWCILSGGDNQIQVYALPGVQDLTPPPSPSPLALPHGSSGEARKRGREGDGVITHSQTLLAHSANVTSVSLSAGKCVSGGNDGRVLVWDLDEEEGGVGRTVGYVEVRTGDERVWRGAAGPRAQPRPESPAEMGEDSEGPGEDEVLELPHPQAISSAARSFFLPRPPVEMETMRTGRSKPAIRQLAFDEEKIVGLVRGGEGSGWQGEGEVMKVWSFG